MAGLSFETEEVKSIIHNFALEAQRQIPIHFNRQRRKVIVLSGPTCCGKSRLGLELAQAIDGEIVSADSVQVYRHMDIGTAKPTPEERLAVPHHLIDIRDVKQSFNVVDFYYEAMQACRDILARGNVPIVVGGSGFYLHALLYGPPSGPPSVPEVRARLEREIDEIGSEMLYERLVQFDPQYAKSITKNDKQKIVRALEIITLTNTKVSKLNWGGRAKSLHYDFLCWFLHRPRECLYDRINKRCDKMLKAGFLDEVRELDKQGLRQNHSASQAIGYRQALDFLQTPQSEKDYEVFVEEFKRSTRQYAKRQCTWFRKEPLFRWLDVDLHDHETAFDIIKKDFESRL